MRYELRERTVIDVWDTEENAAITTWREEEREDAEANVASLNETADADA